MNNNYLSLQRINKLCLALLIILVPFIQVLPIQISLNIGGYNLTSLYKELFSLIIISISILFILKEKKITGSKVVIFFVLIYLLYAAFHVPISILDLSVSFDKFRLVYLYPIMFFFLYLTLFKYNYILKPNFIKLTFIVQSSIMILFGLLEFVYRESLLQFIYKDAYFNLQNSLYGYEGMRTVSLLSNPIILGIFLNIGLVFILFSKFKSKQWLIIKWILLLLNLIVIFSTYSRIAYIITAVIIVQYIISKNMRLSFMYINISIVILICLMVFTIEPSTDSFVGKRISQLNAEEMSEDIRIKNWDNYLDTIFSSNRMLFFWGSGLGSSDTTGSVDSEYVTRVENSFVTILGETGIIGLAIFLTFILRYLYNVYVIYRHKDYESFNILLGILITLVIGAITNDVFQNNPFSFYFWLFLFLSEIYRLKINQKSNNHTMKLND